MKIIRHLTATGPAHAALQPDGSAREITGDIFGTYQVTDRVVKPGKLLAPIVPPNILAIGLNYKKHAEEGGKGVPLARRSSNAVSSGNSSGRSSWSRRKKPCASSSSGVALSRST